MKQVKIAIIVLFGAFLSYYDGYQKITESGLSSDSTVVACGPPCFTPDSLALIDIYNNTFPFTWTNQWDVNQPVCEWWGVTLNSSGRVEELVLGSNNLIGFIPTSIGNLTELDNLQLDANTLSGSIPSSIGNLIKLQVLWLDNNDLSGIIPSSLGNLTALNSFFIDDNNLSGTLPDELGNLVSLMTFFMDNNQITGAVPQTMSNMPIFIRFELFNNKIDSLPDLTGNPFQNNRFKVQNNSLTFDDILPNIGLPMGIFYHPQDSIGMTSTQVAATSSIHTIDLDIDDGISNNQYQWYKDGLPYGSPLTNNQLNIGPIAWSDAGVYTCEVTNPGASLLTLYSRPVTLLVICGTSVENMNDTLCTGASIMVNGTEYNVGNPSGSELFPLADQYGCDSIVNIDLSFQAAPIDTFQQLLCPGESMVINGTSYNPSNPTGTEVFVDAIGPGCDSTVFVDLTFIPFTNLIGEIADTICVDDIITVNGVDYGFSNPWGLEVLEDSSYQGCDSTVSIFLSFYPPAEEDYEPSLCASDSIIVNGTVYNSSNPSGTEIIPNASINGCDSIINVNLQFGGAVSFDYFNTICEEDEEVINGTTYNFSNPTGSEFYAMGAQSGCDSIVNISLSFFPPAIGTYNEIICEGSSTIINGETFDSGNTASSQVIPDASQNGCDSTVNVSISFHPEASGTYSEIICEGQSTIINGETFNASNLNNLQNLGSIAQFGCDSLLNVSISFYPESPGSYSELVCLNGSTVINGETFDDTNTSSQQNLGPIAQNGCDSLLDVSISFYPESLGSYSEVICPRDFVVINGEAFDESNTSNQQNLGAIDQNGCDSLLNVSITFYPEAFGTYETTICSDDSILINGTMYSSGNPTGSDTLSGISQNGCDSIVQTTVSFYPLSSGNYSAEFCESASVNINGTIYDIDNPSGTEILEDQAQFGCDSILNVNLTFTSDPSSDFSPTWCPDQSIVINGTTYDFSNQTGTETLTSVLNPECDSIVYIDLNFFLIPEVDYQPQLCQDGFVIVNGVVYNLGNPSGTETLTSVLTGCDSIVHVDLSFGNEIIEEFTPTYCPDNSIIINGNLYNQSNPIGSETFPGMGQGGCDSTLNISITFLPPAIGAYEPTLCPGEIFEINGETFDSDNPTGQVILAGEAFGNCDSILNVNLSFYEPAVGEWTITLCEGDSIEINGTIYSQSNPNGAENFPMQSQNGCDSTLAIDVFFNNGIMVDFSDELCFGDSMIINGTVYDSENPSGTEVFNPNGSCDSTVQIDLSFFAEATGELSGTYCDSVTFNVGGELFGPSNPSGIVVLENVTANGCDSTVQIDLEFFLDHTFELTETYCTGDSIIINNTVYNINNQDGIEIIPNIAQGGCDSTIIIDLTFATEAFEIFQSSLCESDSLLVNGNWYHAGNPTGQELIVGGSSNNCDSIVEIRLNFYPTTEGMLQEVFCEGTSIEINGNIYDINNPVGQELLENASYLGCDSLLTIDLSFDGIFEEFLDTTLCEGMTLSIGQEVFDSPGQYDVVLTSTSGCDSIIHVTLDMEDPFVFGSAEGGADEISCEKFSSLSAQLNSGQIGFWSSMNNSIVDHINQANSGTSNLQPGDNIFVWTVSTDICPHYDRDTAVITYYPLPNPREDSFFISTGINLFTLDFLANDSFPVGVESPFTLEVSLNSGGLIMQEDTFVQIIPNLGFEGLVTGTYMICGTYCPDFCLEAPFEIEIGGRQGRLDDDWAIPNGITPNNDGANDVLILDPLFENPEEYPNNELLIFNRWGSIVYQAKPYSNDWDGRSQNGNDLPEGTYYYIFRLDLGEGDVFKGDITIIR